MEPNLQRTDGRRLRNGETIDHLADGEVRPLRWVDSVLLRTDPGDVGLHAQPNYLYFRATGPTELGGLVWRGITPLVNLVLLMHHGLLCRNYLRNRRTPADDL